MMNSKVITPAMAKFTTNVDTKLEAELDALWGSSDCTKVSTPGPF
jgi:hypothetical protein